MRVLFSKATERYRHSRWRYPSHVCDIVHSPLRDILQRRVWEIEKGRDWSYRPFRVSKGNFLKSEKRTSGSLKNELLSCSEKGCQLKWHPFSACMLGCKLCFFGRFYVSLQISRKNGKKDETSASQASRFVFPKETSWNLFWKHQEVSRSPKIELLEVRLQITSEFSLSSFLYPIIPLTFGYNMGIMYGKR